MKKSVIFLSLVSCLLLIVSGCNKTSKKEDSLVTIEGFWEGTIDVPEQPLPIQFTFNEDKNTISIPLQGLFDYPLTSVTVKGEAIAIQLDIQGQHITFNGTIKEKQISGTFKQQGQSFPFKLRKETKEETRENQHLIEVDVTGGHLLSQLELPEGEGPFPLMVIIAGSGPTDQDGNSLLLPGKNDSLKMLAEQLATKGVASIRYDKRGVGRNTNLGGKEEDLRFEQYIEDAAAFVQFARSDERFTKVGIIGHSEGSLIGMVAAYEAKADIFISLAGAGRPIDEVLVEQLTSQLSSDQLQEAKTIIDKLKQGEFVTNVSVELQSIFRPSVQPYLQSWLTYDPTKALQQLDIPVLIVQGDRDLQISVTDAKRLHQAKPDATLVIVEKMNHVLKEAPENREDNLAAYTNPDLPLAAPLIEEILNFMQEAIK